MTQQLEHYDTEGRQLTLEQMYATAQAQFNGATGGEGLPKNTTDTRALAGLNETKGDWLLVSRLWGPKDLGKGPVMAAELGPSGGPVEILYFGGLLEPGLESAKQFVDEGLFFWFRYTYHTDVDKGKNPYYTCEGKFSLEQPND